MIYNRLKWLLGSALLAALAAELLGRAAGWGALGPGNENSQKVALTFDDGPSERTAELLAVLNRHRAKATFFVTQPACDASPAGLAALRASGHQLEAHGRWHRHALLLLPWQEWAQVAWHPRAAQAGPKLYRPPYGGHSPLTRLLARLLEREIALWDTESRDWTAGANWTSTDATSLASQTLVKARGGSVILLHDGPAVTPELLEHLLVGLEECQMAAVTLDELPMRRITLKQGLGRLRQSYGA